MIFRPLKRDFIVIRFSLLLFVAAGVLVGCNPVSERECGVFDHPELALWQADTGESNVSFMSSDGTTIDFVRQAVVLNTPFLGSDGSSNDEDVVCELSASVRYQATDSALAITSVYLQDEKLLLDSADEALYSDHLVEEPAGTELAGSYLADISVNLTRVNFDPDRVQYLEEDVTSEEIGGLSYEDVIRIGALDISAVTTVADPDVDTGLNASAVLGIVQVVIARNAGLVAFSDSQDREFVRVAAP